MSVKLQDHTPADADKVTDAAVKPEGFTPVDEGGPITAGGVTLAVCDKPAPTDADKDARTVNTLCRRSSAGAYRPTGKLEDIGRALAAGLIE